MAAMEMNLNVAPVKAVIPILLLDRTTKIISFCNR